MKCERGKLVAIGHHPAQSRHHIYATISCIDFNRESGNTCSLELELSPRDEKEMERARGILLRMNFFGSKLWAFHPSAWNTQIYLRFSWFSGFLGNNFS